MFSLVFVCILGIFAGNSYEGTPFEVSPVICALYGGIVSPNGESCVLSIDLGEPCLLCIYGELFPDYNTIQNVYGPGAPDSSACKDFVEGSLSASIPSVQEVTGDDCHNTACLFDGFNGNTAAVTTSRCVDKSISTEYFVELVELTSPASWSNPTKVCACAPVTSFDQLMYVGASQVLPLGGSMTGVLQAQQEFEFQVGFVQTQYYGYLVATADLDFVPLECTKVACGVSENANPTQFETEDVVEGIFGLKARGSNQYLCSAYGKFRLCSQKSRMANFHLISPQKRSESFFSKQEQFSGMSLTEIAQHFKDQGINPFSKKN
jgi:hypothetical protein